MAGADPARADPAVAGTASLPGGRLAGVIFDMDGVVIDSEPLSLEVIAEIVLERGGHADPAGLLDLAGVGLAQALQTAAERSGRALDAAELRRSYDDRYLPRLRAGAVPTPGLVSLVTGLRSAGIPVALASSSSLTEIDAVVTALRLGPDLAAIASAEEVTWPKPAPDVYLLAVQRLGTGSGGVVAIEDSATGAAAAAAAGLMCVGIRTAATSGHDLRGTALTVSSLEELDVAVLERLVAGPSARLGSRTRQHG